MALLLAAIPAMAQNELLLSQPHQAPAPLQLEKHFIYNAETQPVQNVATRAENSMDICYCGSPYTAYGINASESGVGIMFPKSMMAQYVGNKITAINVAAPVNRAYSTDYNFINTLTRCKVYITTSLNGLPQNITEGTLGSEGFEYNTITLAEPFEIDGTSDVYVCVEYSGVTSQDLIMIVDNGSSINENGGYLYSKFNGVSQSQIITQPNMEWKEFASWIGGNFCIKATVAGDNLPVDMAYMYAYDKEKNIKPGKPFNFLIGFVNQASNNIESVEVTMNIGDQAPQTCEASALNGQGQPASISYNDYGLAFTEFTCDKEGLEIPFTTYVSKINGNENKMADKIVSGTIMCLENGYTQVTVIEELTSAKCAYCPVGITGMEQMKEKYGTKGLVIPIAVHVPSPAADAMDVGSKGGCYAQILTDVAKATGATPGAPSSFFNREFTNNVYPYPQYLEEEYTNYWADKLTFAQVVPTIQTTDNENTVNLNVEVTSSMNIDDANYGISYTIIEDNLGPYMQSNGYSGMSGDYCGWEKKGSSIAMKYNDVARAGSLYYPTAETSIASLTAGQPVTITTPVSLTAVKDLNNYSIAAMLINKKTGKIVNAGLAKPGDTSLSNLSSDSNGIVAYGLKGAVNMVSEGNIYTMDGRAVAIKANGMVSLPAGLYIVATPNGNAKIVVR